MKLLWSLEPLLGNTNNLTARRRHAVMRAPRAPRICPTAIPTVAAPCHGDHAPTGENTSDGNPSLGKRKVYYRGTEAICSLKNFCIDEP